MNILNKYPILAKVQKIDENSILLKFIVHPYVVRNEDVFLLRIVGEGIARFIELIIEYHLNYPTVVVDDGELTFYDGNLDESPDWGDWTSALSLPFEKYDFEFKEDINI